MDPDALELAVRIRSSAGRLSRLLDDLLDLDRLSRGVLDAQRRAVPVDEVIEHTIEGVTLGERDVRVDGRSTAAGRRASTPPSSSGSSRTCSSTPSATRP